MGATQSTSIPHTLRTRNALYNGTEQLDGTGRSILRRYARIPYAKPPIGPLRFRRPQPLHQLDFGITDGNRSGIVTNGSTYNDLPSYDCTKFGPQAPQPEYNTKAAMVNPPDKPPAEEDEDCLYLNVWVPLTSDPPAAGWPVQFHIHGGWLQVGSANTNEDSDPFDLFATEGIANRIIVAPTYRLNLFGFAAGRDLASTAQFEGDVYAGNYGLWDQRLALEWVHDNIADFGGNPSRITVGGLSAGAHSALMQLHYDVYLPAERQIISQVYLWSNALLVQPNQTDGEILTQQFDDLCKAAGVKRNLPSQEKVDALRKVDSTDLIKIIPQLKMHTFRSSTDGAIGEGGFIPPTYLQSLHNGSFASKLAKRGVRIMLGEVKDEGLLYKLINPPSSRDGLKASLANYYPTAVVDALVDSPLYNIPEPGEQAETTDKKEWADLLGTIAADCQVHAAIRGMVKAWTWPSAESQDQTGDNNNKKVVSGNSVFRYQIRWRAKGLDNVFKPEVGVCHAADTPIWWASGWRAGFDERDKQNTVTFLKPFGKFLHGEEDIGWGGNGEVDEIRVLREDGVTEEGVKDELWARGIEVWDAVWQAQKN